MCVSSVSAWSLQFFCTKRREYYSNVPLSAYLGASSLFSWAHCWPVAFRKIKCAFSNFFAWMRRETDLLFPDDEKIKLNWRMVLIIKDKTRGKEECRTVVSKLNVLFVISSSRLRRRSQWCISTLSTSWCDRWREGGGTVSHRWKSSGGTRSKLYQRQKEVECVGWRKQRAPVDSPRNVQATNGGN